MPFMTRSYVQEVRLRELKKRMSAIGFEIVNERGDISTSKRED